MSSPDPLSRREREIMDIVYRLGRVSVGQVSEAMAAPPSYSTVRTLMGTLVKKGHLQRTAEGARYVYQAVVPRADAQRSALARIVRNLFGGSPEAAAMTLMEMSDLDPGKVEELRALIESARQEGR